MLATELPNFKKTVNNIINSGKTATAFKTAFLNTFPFESQDNEQFQSLAENFGKIAALHLSRAIADDLCNAINDFVKEIKFIITPKALTSPMGPVTGVINPDDITQIL